MLLDNGIIATHPSNDINLPIDKKINIAPFGKVGCRYQIIKPLYLKLESFYTYQLGKEAFLTETNNTNLFAYGLNVGIEYKLK